MFHVADSPVIKEYLDSKYKINSKYLGYGAGLNPFSDENLLEEYGLTKNQYFLLMARLEPENNIEMVLNGFCLTSCKTKFIVIGNTANSYGKYLVKKYKFENRIVFLGAIFDEAKVQSVTAFCKLYFHGHSVGGTNPSLLDAMAARAPLAIHNNAFNSSVVRGNALYFSNATDVYNILNGNQFLNQRFINNNCSTIANEFTWDQIVDQYENYFLTCYLANRRFHPLQHEESILYKR
jgi:glycosyltransferase involved in cell wall biosynthesis